MKQFEIGRGVTCDLDRLVDTRLLVQANSGGGKSWLLRRILEQTHGHVQHLVIDPEGEFASLRERFDYVLAAKHGGDTAADHRGAALLAERLLELKVSAILDIYELKPHERIAFVRRFLEALIDAPKSLWHPALVVVDECHVYCPQVGEAESAGAVKDLATRGRKRGFCAVLASQRLSKLHKDAAAECNNKLIGRTSLDVDMKRAADELGFTTKDQTYQLRDLRAGEFYAFGPAFSVTGIARVEVGPVETTHPKAGARLAFTAPPPTSKVKALLPKLADLPAEAEERVKSVEALKRDVAELRRELTIAKKAQPVAETKTVEKPILKDGQLARAENIVLAVGKEFLRHEDALGAILAKAEPVFEGIQAAIEQTRAPQRNTPTMKGIGVGQPRVGQVAPPRPASVPRSSSNGDGPLGKCERAILTVLANQPDGCTSGRLTLLTGYRYSGGFKNSLSALRQTGYLVGENTATMQITDAGREAIGPVDPLPAGADLGRYWLQHPSFGKCEAAILGALLEHPDGLTAEQLCSVTNYQYSGGFKNSLSNLRTAGVLIGKNTEVMRASDELFG